MCPASTWPTSSSSSAIAGSAHRQPVVARSDWRGYRARPTARGARADAPAPAAPAPTAGLDGTIARWSVQVNSPDWNQNLGVTDTRQRCSSSPMDCVNLVRKVAQTSNVRATLVVPLNGTTIVADALQFSELSLNAPFLVEVRID